MTVTTPKGTPVPELLSPHNSHMSHGVQPSDQHTKPFMRPTVQKHSRPTPYYASMSRRQSMDTTNGHANESAGLLDLVETSPLYKPPQGKTLATPRAVQGHRSRIGEVAPQPAGFHHNLNGLGNSVGDAVGAAVLKDAFKCADANTCMAHGRNRDGSKK